MKEKYNAIIIGGGISGASTAYHLKKFGLENVLLLERDWPASGGTGKSAAIVRQHYSTELMSFLALKSVKLFENMFQIRQNLVFLSLLNFVNFRENYVFFCR